MAYSAELDARVMRIIAKWQNTDSKKMFGGVCYLLNGNMVCGVNKDSVILRLGEEGAIEALGRKNVRTFDMTGRAMKGWVMVDRPGIATDEALEQWVGSAKQFVDTLPPK